VEKVVNLPVAKKSKGINSALEDSLSKLLEQVMSDPMATLTDKCKVIDRVINVEKIKQKISDDEWGSGLLVENDDGN
jgi:hypothetical protein